MSEKKYVVPEGMYNAVIEVLPPHVRVQLSAMMGFPGVQRILEAALGWLSENPIEPTGEQMACLKMSCFDWSDNEAPSIGEFIVEWQRRMFVAPEPEVPEEIKDLLHPSAKGHSDYNESIIEAYRRGKDGR